MTELRQRSPRQRDDTHLRYVRARPCSIKFCRRPSEAAHIRFGCIAIGKPPTGMGEKPSDMWTCPLCEYHHRTGIAAQHKMGEEEFWRMAGLNPFEIAGRLWIESGGAMRAIEPKPAKRPRKIKARDRSKPTRKIRSRSTFPHGRKIPSRPFAAVSRC